MMRARPAGDAGLLIDTDQPPAWLAAAIAEASLPGVCDIVPGARTVLVISSPGEGLPAAELAARIAALLVPARAGAAKDAIEIPVVYDGPDLAEVASLTGLSVDEVIAARLDRILARLRLPDRARPAPGRGAEAADPSPASARRVGRDRGRTRGRLPSGLPRRLAHPRPHAPAPMGRRPRSGRPA